MPINYKDQSIREATDNLYGELQKHGVEVLLDDRDERPGVKFKDADLVGIPLRVTIGAKGLEKGCLELRPRREGKTEEVPVADAQQKFARSSTRRCRRKTWLPSSSWFVNTGPCASD